MEVRNRFKELDLIQYLMNYGWRLETGIKTIPKTKKCQKAKWLSEEALQIAEERKDTKGKR